MHTHTGHIYVFFPHCVSLNGIVWYCMVLYVYYVEMHGIGLAYITEKIKSFCGCICMTVLPSVYLHMNPHIAHLGRSIFTLITFMRPFIIMYFSVTPQIHCCRCIPTLVTSMGLFPMASL